MATQYTDRVIAGMQALYGDGFLSPGGPREMTLLLEHAQFDGCRILDFGSGLGGASIMIAERFADAQVTGIDIDSGLVDYANTVANERKLADRVRFEPARTAGIQFPDNAFDVVFTKDVICHIPDKAGQFLEFGRVLAPGGQLVCADFATVEAGENAGQAVVDWIDSMRVYGLEFNFEPLDVYAHACAAAGFHDVDIQEHTEQSQCDSEREVDFLLGTETSGLREDLGNEKFRTRIHASVMRLRALRCGGLRHVHIRASR